MFRVTREYRSTNILVREPCVRVRGPCILLRGPCVLRLRARHRDAYVQRAGMLATTEPYILTKEPYLWDERALYPGNKALYCFDMCFVRLDGT